MTDSLTDAVKKAAIDEQGEKWPMQSMFQEERPDDLMERLATRYHPVTFVRDDADALNTWINQIEHEVRLLRRYVAKANKQPEPALDDGSAVIELYERAGIDLWEGEET